MPDSLIMKQTDAPIYSDSCYLLVDGLAMDVPFTAYNLDDHPITEPLFRGTRHTEVIEASPWLVKPSAKGRLLASTESWRSDGVVVYSDAPMNVLANHLRSLISITLPSDQLAYCRFYAPNWSSRLFSSMSTGEFEAWSGPITQWRVFTKGTWQSYVSKATGAPRHTHEEGWYKLRERQLKQWEAEEYQRFVDKTALDLGCRPEHQNYVHQREQIDNLIQQAHEDGFTLEHQCLHYLELAWRFPQEFSRQGCARELLANAEQSANQRLKLAEKQLFGLDKDV